MIRYVFDFIGAPEAAGFREDLLMMEDQKIIHRTNKSGFKIRQ
jgi:hypothetical protein